MSEVDGNYEGFDLSQIQAVIVITPTGEEVSVPFSIHDGNVRAIFQPSMQGEHEVRYVLKETPADIKEPRDGFSQWKRDNGW